MTPSGADAWLVDERWFKAYPLADQTTIGRGADSMIILRDHAVSRHHADVRREEQGYVLHAYGASGLTVNGAALAVPHVLREGDLVEIAFTALRFTTKPPASEMLVLPRDTPTPLDSVQAEASTSVTLRAMQPARIARGARRYWRLIGIVLFIAALLLFVLAA